VLNPNLVFLGAFASLVGTLAYSWQTLKGKAQPNRVTWTLWSIAPILAFVAEVNQGVGLQSVMTLTLGLGPMCVLTASFISKSASWKLGSFDVACGVMSVVGIIVWAVTSNATVALVSFMVADGLAGLPTLVKAYRDPESEKPSTYIGGIINAAFTMATITKWTTAEFAFPVQILIFNSLEVFIITSKIGPRLRGELFETPTQPEHALPSAHGDQHHG
jgi:hypothetical protein